MKSLSFSGGGTKIAALAGAAITLMEDYNYKPDIIVGTSSGGILSLPIAMGLFYETKELIFSLTYNKLFDIKPINDKGKIRLWPIIRVLFGAESLGKQNNLIKTISKLITKERFEEYKTNDAYPSVYLVAVEFKTGKRKYFDVKKLNYAEYLKAVNATSAIPFFVESVKYDNGYYYDGSLRDHLGSSYIMENFNITENVSIYSRPEDYNKTDLNWYPKNVVEVILRSTDIMLTEISKNDEFQEDSISEKKNIKNTKIFMPHILSSNSYELNKEKLKEWFNIGKAATEKYLKK